MKNKLFRLRRPFLCVVLILCLSFQGISAMAAGIKVANEYDLALVFHSAYKTDPEFNFLKTGTISRNLLGTNGYLQTKTMLTSEPAYNAIKAFFPHSFTINYALYSDGQVSAKLEIEAASMVKKATDTAKKVFNEIIRPEMSDTEKVKAIHDYIVLNCEYDRANMYSKRFAPFSYYGVFINKTAVCSGYADAFLLLCNMAGIPCLVVCGTSVSDGKTMPHAWNMVCLDGKWFYVDATFDDPYPDRAGQISYDYYLLDYERISADHTFNESYYFTLAEYLNTASPQYASRLNKLGLFKGSYNGFDLDRAPTRAEAAVMLVRLLGKEQEATDPINDYANATPFHDLPAWAAGHIGYLYANGITMGVSQTAYGSNSAISSSQYLTFILRLLGYQDSVDFVWNRSAVFAQEIGLVSSYKINAWSGRPFLRADLADISSGALLQTYKASGITLFSRLLLAGVFSTEQAIQGGYLGS